MRIPRGYEGLALGLVMLLAAWAMIAVYELVLG
jgi:hypothetical protein